MRLVCQNTDDVGHALSFTGDEYLKSLMPLEVEDGGTLPSLPSHVLSLNALKTLPLLDQIKLLLKDGNLF